MTVTERSHWCLEMGAICRPLVLTPFNGCSELDITPLIKDTWGQMELEQRTLDEADNELIWLSHCHPNMRCLLRICGIFIQCRFRWFEHLISIIGASSRTNVYFDSIDSWQSTSKISTSKLSYLFSPNVRIYKKINETRIRGSLSVQHGPQ